MNFMYYSYCSAITRQGGESVHDNNEEKQPLTPQGRVTMVLPPPPEPSEEDRGPPAAPDAGGSDPLPEHQPLPLEEENRNDPEKTLANQEDNDDDLTSEDEPEVNQTPLMMGACRMDVVQGVYNLDPSPRGCSARANAILILAGT